MADSRHTHEKKAFFLHEPLHWKAKRDPEAEMLSLQSFLRKGVSLGYVWLDENLKDLKRRWQSPFGGDTLDFERIAGDLRDVSPPSSSSSLLPSA